jgi:hypothetical protein
MRCHASDAPAPDSRRPSIDYNVPISPYLQSPKLAHREGRIVNSITGTMSSSNSSSSSSSTNSSNSSLNSSHRPNAELSYNNKAGALCTGDSSSSSSSATTAAAASECSGLQVTTAAATGSEEHWRPPKTPPTQPSKVLRKGAEERMALLSLATDTTGIVSKRGLLCRGMTSSCASSSKHTHTSIES